MTIIYNEKGIPQTGSTGIGSGDLTYAHNQAIASTDWTVPHNLGKFPSVIVVDTDGRQWIGDVVHVDEFSLTIHFAAAFAGKAYCN